MLNTNKLLSKKKESQKTGRNIASNNEKKITGYKKKQHVNNEL